MGPGPGAWSPGPGPGAGPGARTQGHGLGLGAHGFLSKSSSLQPPFPPFQNLLLPSSPFHAHGFLSKSSSFSSLQTPLPVPPRPLFLQRPDMIGLDMRSKVAHGWVYRGTIARARGPGPEPGGPGPRAWARGPRAR